MSRFRHSSSFVISSSIYALLIFLYVSFLNTPKPIKEKKKEQIVKIALIIPPPPKVEAKPIIVPPKPIIISPKPKLKPKKKKIKIIKKAKPTPKPTSKPKPKKIPKPTPKPIIEEIYEEPVKKPEPIIEEIYIEERYQQPIRSRVSNPIIEEIYEEPIREEVYQEPKRRVEPTPIAVEEIPPPTPKVDLSAQKQSFKSRVRENIIANKKYPRMAKRRRIQGTVHVVFDIGIDGMATNIHTSGASSLLQKATKRSIEKSFPIDIPNVIMGEFPMRNVSINIDFILE